MSTSAKRGLTTFFVSLAGFILMTALVMGYTYYKRTHQGHSRDTAIEQSSETVLGNTYQLIQPSVGTLQVTLPVTIAFDNGDATVPLDFPGADRVETGMALIVHDDTGAVWPHKGRIDAITDNAALLIFPADMPLPAGPAQHKADLIVFENLLAKRVPLIALQRDDAGTYFVWKAVKVGDAFHIERRDLPAPIMNDAFFDVSNAVRADEYVVLNPDTDLQDSAQLSSVILVEANAPALDPQEQALQKLDAQIEEKLIESLPSQAPPGSAACGNPQSTPADGTPVNGNACPANASEPLEALP